jgi:aldehyde:ferredoxin oxidoreductase
LAWATEALERGLITDSETNRIKLKWGDYLAYIEAVKLIVDQPNDFYKALARGVDHAASLYGGQEFALAFGGNEMPGYHTGYAAHIGFQVGTRHSHLDNAGYSIDQKFKKLSQADLAEALLNEERWRQVLSSLVICFFARNIYQPEIVSKALQSAGQEFSVDDLNTGLK